MINVFLFSFHEQFWSSLDKWPSLLLPTALCLASLVAMKKFSAIRLVVSMTVAVCIGVLIVFVNKDGLNGVLLKLFGVHLPVFALFTLVAPAVVMTLATLEIIFKKQLVSTNLAFLLAILLVGLNIDILNGVSVSIARAQDYEKEAEAVGFIIGTTSALATYLTLPPLIAGASQQLLSPRRGKAIVWLCILMSALSSVWVCQVYLGRILRNVALLYLS